MASKRCGCCNRRPARRGHTTCKVCFDALVRVYVETYKAAPLTVPFKVKPDAK